MPDDAKPRYYPLLDSVLFDGNAADDLPQRAVGATAALLLDLVVHRIVPVLSQSQAIDSSYFLDLVQDDAGAAFLRLVENGEIQTRFMANGLEAPSDGSDRFTVLNVFASKLRSNFHFSAWPELADADARTQVYASVRGLSNEPVGGELGVRLDALRQLDAAFRYSSVSEEAKELPAEQQLKARVTADFGAHDGAGPIAELSRSVLRLADESGADDRGRPVIDLNTRSAWRNAMRDAADRLGLDSEFVADMSTVVDLHYNCVVAASIGAASYMDETSQPRVPIGLHRSTVPIELDPRISFLLDGARDKSALTWTEARERLDAQRSATPETRLNSLFEDHLVETVEGGRLLKVVSALPRRLMRAAHVGAPAGGAGFVVGSHLGLIGAVLGGIVGEAVTPDELLLGGALAERWETKVRARAVGRLRRSVGITADTERR